MDTNLIYLSITAACLIATLIALNMCNPNRDNFNWDRTAIYCERLSGMFGLWAVIHACMIPVMAFTNDFTAVPVPICMGVIFAGIAWHWHEIALKEQ